MKKKTHIEMILTFIRTMEKNANSMKTKKEIEISKENRRTKRISKAKHVYNLRIEWSKVPVR